MSYPRPAYVRAKARANNLATELRHREDEVTELRAERDCYRAALRVIRGPADQHDRFMDTYVASGGGYEGLQAIAGEALEAGKR